MITQQFKMSYGMLKKLDENLDYELQVIVIYLSKGIMAEQSQIWPIYLCKYGLPLNPFYTTAV